MGKKIDLTGKRFGRLVVVRETAERRNGFVMWECKCDCGKLTTTKTCNLNNGKTTSCGCKQREYAIKTGTELGKKTIKIAHKYSAENEYKELTMLSSLASKKLNKNNKSGIRGVTWTKQNNLWRARIMFQGQEFYLGYFDKLEDAAKARKEAEEKYFTPILEKYGRDTESHELSAK